MDDGLAHEGLLTAEDRGVELVADAVLRHEARLLFGGHVVAVSASGRLPIRDDLRLDVLELRAVPAVLELLEEELLELDVLPAIAGEVLAGDVVRQDVSPRGRGGLATRNFKLRTLTLQMPTACLMSLANLI